MQDGSDTDGGNEDFESLSDFIRGSGPTDHQGDDGETGDDGGDDSPGLRLDDGLDEGSDTGGEPDEATAEEPIRASHSKMVRKLAQRDRELSDTKRQLRELQEREQARAAEAQDPEDIIDLVRHRIAKRMGLKAGDPQVTEALFEVSKDLTIEHLGEAADAVEEYRNRRVQLAADRKAREAQRRLEDENRDLKERSASATYQRGQDQLRANIDASLRRDPTVYPFLSDVPDAAEEVRFYASEAVRLGKVRAPKTDADAEAILSQVAKGLDSKYRDLAKALSKKLGPKARNAADDLDDTDSDRPVAKKRPAQKRAGSGTRTGGGGLGRPVARQVTETADDDESESLSDFMKRETRREAALTRGRH